MIIGSIKKGIKRIIEIKLRREDMQDLAVLKANLISRLATQTREAQENALKTIREIDKHFN